MTDQSRTLTARGWPRPRQRDVVGEAHTATNLPVPWISPAERLKETNPKRHSASITALLCQVCGHGHEPQDKIFIFVNQHPDDIPDDLHTKEATAMDDAVMHLRCAKLVLKHCPGVRGVWKGTDPRSNGGLTVVSARTQHVYVIPVKQQSRGERIRDLIMGRRRQRSGGIDPSEPRLAVDGEFCTIYSPEETLAL